MANSLHLRVLDAATNRANEGLRVVEDYVRFVQDDSHLTQLLKQFRHDLVETCAVLPLAERHAARDTQQDVGTELSTYTESKRDDTWAVCVASLERVKQSLRSLEEFGKLIDPEISARLEALRYRLYTLERSVSITHDSLERLADVRLCALVDAQESEAKLELLVKQLLEAGVQMIQLREKTLPDGELIRRARLLRAMVPCPDGEALLVINDRPDIAAAVDSDGVHLGQEDLNVKDARKIVGPRKLIGVSTHSLAQARAAVLDGATYLGVGPTFPSETKSFDTFAGLDFLRQVAEEISLPTFAIGGISLDNLDEVLETGMTRIAVSRGIVAAQDPGAAAQELLERLTGAIAR